MEPPASASSAGGLPEELLVGDEEGPALYLGPEADAPAIGFVAKGTRVRLRGGITNDRVFVHVYGGMKARGYLPITRLAARVQQRGRVDGTPTYVGPNDFVRVRGPGAPGKLRVEIRPWLGRPSAPEIGSFVGEMSIDELGAAEVDLSAAQGPTAGQPYTLPAGQDVPVYDRPSGTVVATLPALEPPITVVVLRDRGEWKGIRAGVGPYLVGYVNVTMTAASAPEVAPPEPAPTPPSGPPRWLQQDASRQLWRVAAGTRVLFNRNVIAVLDGPGYAREMNRFAETNEVDVFVAADDEVAVRGMLPAAALQPVDGAAPADSPVE